MSPEAYAAHRAHQRLLGMAEVHTMLMQMRLDVFYRGPGRPVVTLRHDKLAADGSVVWVITDDADGMPLWDAAATIRTTAEEFWAATSPPLLDGSDR